MANAISTITLCNVPITPLNQLTFNSRDEQKAYFQSKQVSVHNCSYQARTGEIEIKGYVDTHTSVNYGYYTNEYNGITKTFYFWIVQKEYISRATTLLTIQLDSIQTWMFDWILQPCMIEREHVANDTIGKNTIPEDFEIGDYISRNRYIVEELTGKVCYLLATTLDPRGGVFGKTYSGFDLEYYKEGEHAILSDRIQSLAENGKADAIAYLSIFPQSFMDILSINLESGDTIGGASGTLSIDKSYTNSFDKNFMFQNEVYEPYNNKLLTYPYNFMTVKNSSGSNVVLKLELFKDNLSNKYDFRLDTVLAQNASVSITPINYAGRPISYEDSILTDGFGLGSWNNDNYANWYAQNKYSLRSQSYNATTSFSANNQVMDNSYNNRLENNDTQAQKNAIGIGGNAIGNLLSGNVGGAIGGAISSGVTSYLDYNQNIRNADSDLGNTRLMNTVNYQNATRSLMASIKDSSVQPNTCKGDTSGSGLDVARGSNTFFIEQTQIKPEFAKMIDMFFQMYGYAVNKLDIPNFKTRSRWNYIKTINGTVRGSIPREDIDMIQQIFNNGLTFWHNENYIGIYNIANTIR